MNWRNQSATLYFTRLHKCIDAGCIRVPKYRKISDDFYDMATVTRCGKTIHCIGIPEANQVFENILSGLSVIKIYQFANKVRSGIAIPGNPFHIQPRSQGLLCFQDGG